MIRQSRKGIALSLSLSLLFELKYIHTISYHIIASHFQRLQHTEASIIAKTKTVTEVTVRREQSNKTTYTLTYSLILCFLSKLTQCKWINRKRSSERARSAKSEGVNNNNNFKKETKTKQRYNRHISLCSICIEIIWTLVLFDVRFLHAATGTKAQYRLQWRYTIRLWFNGRIAVEESQKFKFCTKQSWSISNFAGNFCIFYSSFRFVSWFIFHSNWINLIDQYCVWTA